MLPLCHALTQVSYHAPGCCCCLTLHPGRCCPTLHPAAATAVHVEAINAAAEALYLSSGFAVESEESEAYARALNRNRRLLLHTTL